MVSRNHKQSRTSILTSLATRTGFCTFPRATASSVTKRPFRAGSGGGRGCATATGGREQSSVRVFEQGSNHHQEGPPAAETLRKGVGV
jgi:hypothetical protein